MSSQTLTKLGAIISQFPRSVLEQVVIHPGLPKDFTWSDIPREVKQLSEMSFYSGYEMDDVYGIYGVDPSKGALAVIRPDGYVGIIADLGDVQRIDNYLGAMIRRN